tara:strand:+ start:585 stop:899 length:315 start_codon:yes stop_codon:yes gene_type:complete
VRRRQGRLRLEQRDEHRQSHRWLDLYPRFDPTRTVSAWTFAAGAAGTARADPNTARADPNTARADPDSAVADTDSAVADTDSANAHAADAHATDTDAAHSDWIV